MVMMTNNFQYGTNELLKNLYMDTSQAYALWPKQYPQIIKLESTSFKTESVIGYEGPASIPQKTEGSDAAITSISEGYKFNFAQKSYAFDMPVTIEQLTYNQNGTRFSKLIADYLTRSANLRYEYEGASPINNGFTAGVYAGGDAVAYFSASHLWKTGGTANNLLTAATLSKTSLKAAIKQATQMTMEGGIPAKMTIDKIVSGTDNIFVLPELLISGKDPESANNTYNVLQDFNIKRVFSNYMSDTNAWIIDSKEQSTRVLKESKRPQIRDYDNHASYDLVVGILTMIGSGFHKPIYSLGNTGS